MNTQPTPARDGSHEARSLIFVTVAKVNGDVPSVESTLAALKTLEGWSGAELVDDRTGAWLVEVPSQTEATLAHEGWLETWAIAPNGERLMISSEWADEPTTCTHQFVTDRGDGVTVCDFCRTLI